MKHSTWILGVWILGYIAVSADEARKDRLLERRLAEPVATIDRTLKIYFP